MKLVPTTSQTVGPFYSIGFEWMMGTDLTVAGAAGERITIRGKIVDGDGLPVPDAVLEIWQADAKGQYADPQQIAGGGFTGFGRIPTDDQGAFSFITIKPGIVRDEGGDGQAPHIVVSIFMRGLLTRLVSRIYFPGEPSNALDPTLRLVPESRRGTVIARQADSPGELEWVVRLQGKDETVFFDF